MTWDHHGRRIEDEDEAAERAPDVARHGYITSGVDRANLVWLIDAYAGQTLLLLARIATAGPAVCWLSTQRLARDCNVEPRTVARYRSALVEDGVLEREKTDDGRTVFWINWHRLAELACEGLMRRPAKERVAIIKNTFRPLINRNGLPFDYSWFERWSDPETAPLDTSPGHFRRKRQNAAPRQGIHAPRQGIQDPGKLSAPPDTMSGPSKPELNPNPEPESTNGSLKGPLDAGADQDGVEPLGDIQVMYAGRPTLMLRVLQVLAAGSAPRSRGEIADALNVHPGEVGRALGELRRRGYAERVDHGRYGLTRAWAEAWFATDDPKHRARTSS